MQQLISDLHNLMQQCYPGYSNYIKVSQVQAIQPWASTYRAGVTLNLSEDIASDMDIAGYPGNAFETFLEGATAFICSYNKAMPHILNTQDILSYGVGQRIIADQGFTAIITSSDLTWDVTIIAYDA